MAGLALPLGFSRAPRSLRKDAQSAFMATRLVTQQVDVAAGFASIIPAHDEVAGGAGTRLPRSDLPPGSRRSTSMSATPLTEFLQCVPA